MKLGTKYSLQRRQRHDNNRIDKVRGHVELLKLHRRERYDNSGIHGGHVELLRLPKRELAIERHDNSGIE